jgi:hypothetical protein
MVMGEFKHRWTECSKLGIQRVAMVGAGRAGH